MAEIRRPFLSQEPTYNRWASLVFLFLSLSTAAYGTGFWLFRDRGPTRVQHQKASSVLLQEAKSSDLVILVPHFATMAREFLGQLKPVATKKILNLDWSNKNNVWVYGLLGDGDRWKEEIIKAGHQYKGRLYEQDGITIDHFMVRNPSKTRYSFRDSIKSANVYYKMNASQTEPCDRWSDNNYQGGVGFGRWSCRRDAEWFYVSPEWHRMGDHLELCLWAHPPNSGQLVIEFPNVPMTGALIGHGGHTLNSSVHARAPIDMSVSLTGQDPQVFHFALKDHYRRFALTTPTSGTATVTFSLSTIDAGANHFCFNAEMRQ